MEKIEITSVCRDCIVFCQEGRIDIPCKGSFECEDKENDNGKEIG